MIKRAFQDITNLQVKNFKLTVHKSSHRRKLLHWVYEVCLDFGYSNFTYITTLLIIDAYTAKNGFDISEYQLIGITSLFIGAKIEEKKLRPVSEYALVTDSSFSTQQILDKEKEILEVLDYNLLFNLPHRYYNAEYFNSHFEAIQPDDKLEMLFSIISALMEHSSYTKNMFLLYLEAVRELELIMKSKSRIVKEVAFYAQKSPRILKILNK